MNSNIKDLILSECCEDNALAVEILKRKRFLPKYRIPHMIDKVIREHRLIHNDAQRFANDYGKYWRYNKLYPMGPEFIFKYNIYD